MCFSTLEKMPWYVLRGNAAQCPSIRVWQSSADRIVMAVWHTFFKIWTSWVGCDSPLLTNMSVWHASNLKKSAPNGHYYMQIGGGIHRPFFPALMLSRKFAPGLEGPKGNKHLRSIPDLGFQRVTLYSSSIVLYPFLFINSCYIQYMFVHRTQCNVRKKG